MVQHVGKLSGKIRIFPKDFIVEEIWSDRICSIAYSPMKRLKDALIKFKKKREYIHFTLVKQNWDNIRALNYIRKRIKVSLKRFGIAGMKDKHAITSQRVSLWNGKAETLARLRLPEMFIKEFQYADERINLGNAMGNRFTITIRDVPINRKTREILSRFQEIVTSQGVPNYYGPQRLRGENVEVGRAIKNGDLKIAVDLILKKIYPWLNKGGIETVPSVFWYEKRMVYHLKKYPKDYAGALRKIPKRIRNIYIHAYQSNIFNHKLRQDILKSNIHQTITIQGFQIPRMPELKANPIERKTFFVPENFKILGAKNGIVKLRFNLGKGEYASTILSCLLK